MSQICTHCKKALLRRSSRSGFVENFVLSLMGYYPWRCSYCKERQMRRDRGDERSRGGLRASVKR